MHSSYNKNDNTLNAIHHFERNIQMTEKELHDIVSRNIDRLLEKETDHPGSMRYLSTCLGANDGYIQRIVNGTSFPSFAKLLDIANHFEVEPWQLLYNSPNPNSARAEFLQMALTCPEELIPVVMNSVCYLNSKSKEQE